WMIERNRDEAVRRERRAEPPEIGRRAAETVGEEDQRTPGPRRVRRVACGGAGAIEREEGRPDPLGFLARLGRGRVPDHRAECVCLGPAPIVWLDWDKISRGDADLKHSVGASGAYRCKENQRQRQKPHSAWPRDLPRKP